MDEKQAEYQGGTLITDMKRAAVCRICRSPLEVEVANKYGGRVALNFRCPRHGTLKKGDRYMTGYIEVFGCAPHEEEGC